MPSGASSSSEHWSPADVALVCTTRSHPPAASSGRLALRASQVGTVAPARSARRSTADRLALALDLLRDPAFDVLVTGESRFDELPGVMARLAAGSLPALCHTITYGGR